MKNLKRMAAALMALFLMLGVLTACGGFSDSSGSGAETPDYVYVAGYSPFDAGADIDYIQNCTWYDGKLYFAANVQVGSEPVTNVTSETDLNGDPIVNTYDNPIYQPALFTATEDGTGVTQLPNYAPPAVPEGLEGSANINNLKIDAQGNLWVYETLYTYTYDLPTDFDSNTQSKWDYYSGGTNENYIRRLDATGAEVATVDLSFMQGDSDYFYINGFTVDNAGNLYIADGSNNLYVFDGTGTQLFEIAGDENAWIGNLMTLADGRAAVLVYGNGEEGTSLKTIDLAAKGFGDSIEAPYNTGTIYSGAGDYDFYYDTGTSLYGYTLQTGTSEKLFSWINCDVDNNSLSGVTPLPDGRILCFTTDYSGDTPVFEIVTMTKTPYSETDQKTVLTYACMYLDWNIRSQIIKFNKTNPDCRIEVQDYSEYNTNDDPSAGLTKLTTEIISGKIPDILYTDSLPIRQYAAKGVLEDLWPYIDADTELGGRDALVTPVFNAMEQDGKLYQVTPGFTVMTVAGAASVVGDTPGWTLDDLYTALDKMPAGTEVFSMGVTKNDIFSQCCAMNLDDFIDWDTGTCTFDSPEFIKLLEFTDLFPETFDWDSIDWESGDYEDDSTRIMSGKQMLAQFYAYDFQYFQMYKAMFGGDVTFIGYPTESRDGSAFSLNGGLAMSVKCADKDAAWQFIRTLLTEDYQEQNGWGGFPTNQKAFDSMLETAMTPDYITDPDTGEQVEQSKGSWGWGDLTVDLYALTQAEADQFTQLIDSTDKIYSYDQDISNIINDETQAYFAGQKSAADTAAMIQSRVSLYVNEQR
jgi:ABC-type glycerol-3-phosphate transport system substrate-binding protein